LALDTNHGGTMFRPTKRKAFVFVILSIIALIVRAAAEVTNEEVPQPSGA
jgi:hypothetical protein